jgi:hypothetical protein
MNAFALPISRPQRIRVALALAALLTLASVGCQTTRQPRGTPEERGFLGDYSMLQPGEDDQASLRYVAPDANFAKYDSVILDSVTIWQSSDTENLSKEEAQALTDYLFEAVHRELSKDYKLVTEPAPGAMRIRAAITEAKGAHVVADTITSVVPQLRLITTLGGMAANTKALVGEAAVEMELVDSMSGRRLAAAVDERWGTKAIRGGILKWSDAKEAFDHWANQLREFLATQRGVS